MSLSREPDCDQVSFSVAECEGPVDWWAVNGIEKKKSSAPKSVGVQMDLGRPLFQPACHDFNKE